LTWISKGEYEIAKNKLTEILRNKPDNIVVINNVAVLNVYLNKVDKAYTDMKIILEKDQLNSFNEITYSNINLLSDLFNLPKYP
jgi:predicted Zn-dependent protease